MSGALNLYNQDSQRDRGPAAIPSPSVGALAIAPFLEAIDDIDPNLGAGPRYKCRIHTRHTLQALRLRDAKGRPSHELQVLRQRSYGPKTSMLDRPY